jgi:hypothetical protein
LSVLPDDFMADFKGFDGVFHGGWVCSPKAYCKNMAGWLVNRLTYWY